MPVYSGLWTSQLYFYLCLPINLYFILSYLTSGVEIINQMWFYRTSKGQWLGRSKLQWFSFRVGRTSLYDFIASYHVCILTGMYIVRVSFIRLILYSKAGIFHFIVKCIYMYKCIYVASPTIIDIDTWSMFARSVSFHITNVCCLQLSVNRTLYFICTWFLWCCVNVTTYIQWSSAVVATKSTRLRLSEKSKGELYDGDLYKGCIF